MKPQGKFFADLHARFANDPDFRTEQLVLRITEALYAAMEDQGLSEADLARRLGVSRQYVNRFLAGRTNTSLRTLVRFAYALGLEVEPPALVPRAVQTEPRPDEWRNADPAPVSLEAWRKAHPKVTVREAVPSDEGRLVA